jgi:hypothetical protein
MLIKLGERHPKKLRPVRGERYGDQKVAGYFEYGQ